MWLSLNDGLHDEDLMMRLAFILLLGATIAATVLLVRARPVKTLSKIQIVLTVLVGIAFIVDLRMAFWLHSMAYADPVRQEWQPKLDAIGSIVWFGPVGLWLAFTLFHSVVILRCRT